ncbi:hypothetical protein GLYMA_02G111250v4 [Glycine max]|nr:hypothetical protein GLYMA_02G111250v4 [Glycine max]KAH1059814.1 hypothetical protein GYH30_003688 [Glycine max]
MNLLKLLTFICLLSSRKGLQAGFSCSLRSEKMGMVPHKTFFFISFKLGFSSCVYFLFKRLACPSQTNIVSLWL